MAEYPKVMLEDAVRALRLFLQRQPQQEHASRDDFLIAVDHTPGSSRGNELLGALGKKGYGLTNNTSGVHITDLGKRLASDEPTRIDKVEAMRNARMDHFISICEETNFDRSTIERVLDGERVNRDHRTRLYDVIRKNVQYVGVSPHNVAAPPKKPERKPVLTIPCTQGKFVFTVFLHLNSVEELSLIVSEHIRALSDHKNDGGSLCGYYYEDVKGNTSLKITDGAATPNFDSAFAFILSSSERLRLRSLNC